MVVKADIALNYLQTDTEFLKVPCSYFIVKPENVWSDYRIIETSLQFKIGITHTTENTELKAQFNQQHWHQIARN